MRTAPLFAFLLAAQFVFEFAVLQLMGECFAPPSAMICAVTMEEQILAWAWDHQAGHSAGIENWGIDNAKLSI